MRTLSIKHILEIVGVLAVVISLLLVFSELRLARTIAESENQLERSNSTRDLNDLIASHADVWAKGCMAEDLTVSESVIFFRIANSVISSKFTSWNMSRRGISTSPGQVPLRALALNLYNFPGLKDSWDNHDLPTSFIEIVNQQVELLVISETDRNMDVAFCGQ